MNVKMGELWCVLDGINMLDIHRDEVLCTKQEAVEWARELNESREQDRADWRPVSLVAAVKLLLVTTKGTEA